MIRGYQFSLHCRLLLCVLPIVIVCGGFSSTTKAGGDDPSVVPKPVTREFLSIAWYKKLAPDTALKETIEYFSGEAILHFQIMDGSYRKAPTKVVGALLLPERSESVPVVVLSPDSSGPSGFYGKWAEPFWKGVIKRLFDKGIGVFIIDGFGTRGISKTYDDQSRYSWPAQTLDTLMAFNVLADDPRVDKKRIGILGHSRGADMALGVTDRRLTQSILGEGNYFAASLAMASSCNSQLFENPKPTPTAVLMLHGLADDYTPASLCIDYAERMKNAGAKIDLVLKEGWHHGFYLTVKAWRCPMCVHAHDCPIRFYSSDDGLMNADFIDFIEKSLDINWKKTLADIVDRLEHEDRYKKFQQIYRKIRVNCGQKGATVGGGHTRESIDIVVNFFARELAP